MESSVEKLDYQFAIRRVTRERVVEAIDEIAADLLKTAEADPETPEGFAEGVQALQAAIAASLGVGTKG